MKLLNLYIVFCLLVAFVCFGCKSNIENNSARRKFHQCKNYELDVPIEAVDVETNGKKNGSTHFPSFSTNTELSYGYQVFDSAEKAQEVLQKDKNKTFQVLRENELKDNKGNKIGEKIIIYNGEIYELFWTNGAKLNLISGESLSAIEEIEKDCNL